MLAKCNRCYDFVIPKVEGVFSRYGRLVCRHPWKFILIPIAVNLLLFIGLIRFELLIDIEKIYTPENSRSEQDRDTVKRLFPDTSGDDFKSYQTPTVGRWGDVIVRPYGGNILNANFLRDVRRLIEYVSDIPAQDDNGNTFVYPDICARAFNACAIGGAFFTDDEFIARVEAGMVTYPVFNHSVQGLIYYELNVAGALASNFGILHEASLLLLRFNIRTDSNDFISKSDKWKDAFLQAMDAYSASGFEVIYSHHDSLSEEINDNLIGDLTFIVLSFFLIGCYGSLATFTSTTNCVSQRAATLGLPGLLAAGLAAGSSLGLITACGFEVVSIVGAVPFLVMGIGVDDMFMLMSGLSHAKYDDDVETRVAETMRTSGVSITITSITDLLAFAAGASSVFLSVRNFCIFAGTAVLVCYINQCTIFLGCIVLNEQRIREVRHCVTSRPVRSREENIVTGKSKAHVLCCSGSPPKSQFQMESLLDKLPRWSLPRIVRPIPMKVIIILVFLGYLGVSVWGITELKEGIDFKTTVREDSYHYKYRHAFDSEFQWLTPISLILGNGVDYSDGQTQQTIFDIVETVKADDQIKDYVEMNWLSAFVLFQRSTPSNTSFIQKLRVFLASEKGHVYKNDVIIDEANDVIVASRIHLMSENIPNSQEQAKFMSSMRDLVDKSDLNVFMYSNLFIFYEQFLVVLPQTIQTVGIAVAMVFFVTFLLMPHPLMMLYVTLTITSITVGVFGFLFFLDLALNSVTMTQVIMSIGFSVDFVAHVCHGFLVAKGDTRQERVDEALQLTGPPIFHGAVSTFLGICALAFAQSFLFFSFFKVMSIVILFGICHALLLLPVILSLIGPKVRHAVKEQEIPKTNAVANGTTAPYEEKHTPRSNGVGIHTSDIPELTIRYQTKASKVSFEEWKKNLDDSAQSSGYMIP